MLEADQLNILTDDIIELDARSDQTRFTGVSLVRGTSQSISDSTLTAISFSSASIDVDNWWTSGTNIVVPAGAIPAGYTSVYVEIHGQTRSATSGVGTRQLNFQLNGGTIEVSQSVTAISGETTTLSHTVWAEVEAGDIIVMNVQQNSGGSLNFDWSTCKVKRLGPAS